MPETAPPPTATPAPLLNLEARKRFEQAHAAIRVTADHMGNLPDSAYLARAVVHALEGLAFVLEDAAGALLLEPYGLGR